jgi:enoyl-CoA hydratase/carnithine racemase
VEGALATPLPKASEMAAIPASALPVLNDVITTADFSADEAKAVGLVDETKVDWSGKVDIDITAEPEISAVDIDIAGLPEPEALEPTRGKSLADNVQIGFAYQMHIDDSWQKVRLQHVSAARTFFVFSHGAKQRKTISMTYRMLSRMCETGRMRAFENAYLLERATARARRQLAALKTPSGAGSRASN